MSHYVTTRKYVVIIFGIILSLIAHIVVTLSPVTSSSRHIRLTHHTIDTTDGATQSNNLLNEILSLSSEPEKTLLKLKQQQKSKLFTLLQHTNDNQNNNSNDNNDGNHLQLMIQLKHHSYVKQVEQWLSKPLNIAVPPDTYIIHDDVFKLSDKLNSLPNDMTPLDYIHYIGHVQPQFKTRLNFTNLSLFEWQYLNDAKERKLNGKISSETDEQKEKSLDIIELYALLIPDDQDSSTAETNQVNRRVMESYASNVMSGLKSHVRQSYHTLRSTSNSDDGLVTDSIDSIHVHLASPQKMVVKTRALFASDVLEYLKNQERVHWIERKLPMGLFNSAGNEILQGDGSTDIDINSRSMQYSRDFMDEKRPIWARGVTGAGEVVGVGDTGIDYDHCFFRDVNQSVVFDGVNMKHRKIIGYQTVEVISEGDTVMKSDKQDVVNGHGTHVTGSIAGYIYNGAPNNETLHRFGGVAKDAKLFFTDIYNPAFEVLLIPDDLYSDYFPIPYKKGGARIHSNSWGCTFSIFYCQYDCSCKWAVTTKYGKAGASVSNDWCNENLGTDCCRVCNVYDSRAAEIDRFVTDNDDMLIIFAAGNVGYTAKSGTVGSPATSKNVLTVGASMTTSANFEEAVDYEDMSDIFEVLKHSGISNTQECCAAKGKTDAETEKIKSLCCPDFIKKWYRERKKYLNSNNMAYFSSRGPSSDGRIKPDVVGPGFSVVSSHSDGDVKTNQCGIGRPAGGNDAALITMKGTSMAAPLVSGSAALVRDYYKQNGVNPSGSLVKATLAHSGHRMTGYVDLNGGGLLAALSKDPNSVSGFGLVSLSKVLSFADSTFKLFSHDRVSISGHDRQVYCYRVSGAHEFKATLSWYDPAVSPSASVLLVNDLDLDVFYYRNGSKSSTRAPGNNNDNGDRLNTIEQVIVSSIPSDYIVAVTVRAERLSASGGQKYALVVTGDVESLDTCWVPPAALSNRVIFFIILGVCAGAAALLVVGAVLALVIIRYRDYKREQEKKFGRTLGSGHVTLQDEDETVELPEPN